MRELLDKVMEEVPLPTGWKLTDQVFETLAIEGEQIQLTGLAAESAELKKSIFASAGDISVTPVERAYFELIERISVIEAEASHADYYRAFDRSLTTFLLKFEEVFPYQPVGNEWIYSRSNGTGAGPTIEAAMRSARLELIERDSILRCWYGQGECHEIKCPNESQFFLPTQSYEFSWVQFEAHTPLEPNIFVIGLFGFPKDEARPTVYGFGAGSSVKESMAKAYREFIQRLGFLWNEALPTTQPEFAPSPSFHQEYYLYPQNAHLLRRWIRGESRCSKPLIGLVNTLTHFQFADLTPENLRGRLYVVKAICKEAIPLTFGYWNPKLFDGPPRDFLIHPIA